MLYPLKDEIRRRDGPTDTTLQDIRLARGLWALLCKAHMNRRPQDPKVLQSLRLKMCLRGTMSALIQDGVPHWVAEMAGRPWRTPHLTSRKIWPLIFPRMNHPVANQHAKFFANFPNKKQNHIFFADFTMETQKLRDSKTE